MMDKSPVTIQLPASLYAELQTLAADEQTDLVEVIRRLVAIANQRHAWRRDLTALRDQIREEGGLQIGTTKEEVVERLRQTRREIFEAEYAHLYR
jgi:DNA anti-recombination protein RmuC